MGTSRGKKQEETYRTNADASIQAVQATPVETKLNDLNLGFLNDVDSGKDVRDITGMKPFLNLYDSATGQQAEDRHSNGIMELSNGGNPAQANALKQYYAYKRQQDAAGQVENAYNQTYQNNTGQLAPMLMNAANSRQMGKAQLAQQQYQTYLNRPKQPALWEKIAGLAIGGAGAAAGLGFKRQ